MSTAIRVEHVSKQYRLGLVGSGTMRDDLESWWYRMRGKQDPTLKLGEINDRTSSSDSNYVWALRDVNFEVKQGEVLGIIGKNGAGKSTLLKLLSRVTAPTTGNIKVKGRIASLLEVGTGFHPELTGKENIFLNGAIMGMKKHEIARKMDEIVDFAGVERYLETPVKRYSSGMYVRLAFAVAAHLEPEILIIDEVLAVGDAEFQKKALGKMKDVSTGQGRTVLFVSHNMTAIKTLCETAIVLKNGQVHSVGSTERAIQNYLDVGGPRKNNVVLGIEGKISDTVRIINARIEPVTPLVGLSEEITVHIEFEHSLPDGFYINLILRRYDDEVILENPSPLVAEKSGRINCTFKIPGNLLNSGTYSLQFNFHSASTALIGYLKDVVEFEIDDDTFIKHFFGKRAGMIRPDIQFNYNLL
jgi:lipopolysaccharide transport system ATP-binding protein